MNTLDYKTLMVALQKISDLGKRGDPEMVLEALGMKSLEPCARWENLEPLYRKLNERFLEAEGRPGFHYSLVGLHIDGVQYAIDCHETLENYGTEEMATKRECTHRTLKLVHEHKHGLVKTIYDHLIQVTGEPVWAMCSASQSCDVYFGGRKGYMCILHLGNPEQLASDKPHRSIAVNWKENNSLFPAGSTFAGLRLKRSDVNRSE